MGHWIRLINQYQSSDNNNILCVLYYFRMPLLSFRALDLRILSSSDRVSQVRLSFKLALEVECCVQINLEVLYLFALFWHMQQTILTFALLLVALVLASAIPLVKDGLGLNDIVFWGSSIVLLWRNLTVCSFHSNHASFIQIHDEAGWCLMSYLQEYAILRWR